MLRAACLPALLAGSLLLAPAPAGALAGAGDIAATRTFVQANYALGRSAQVRLPVAERTINGVIHQLQAQCGQAAAGSPEDDQAEQLSNEIVVLLTVIAYRSDAAGVDSFVRSVQGLHWSNPKVTRTVGRYLARIKGLTAMPVPHLCADIKAWAASGYKTVSPNTLAVNKRFNIINEGPGSVSRGLLAPYLQTDDARTFSSTQRLESHLLEVENNRGAEYWSRILTLTGLNP